MLLPVLESARPPTFGIYDPVLSRLAPNPPTNTKKRLTPSDFDAAGSSGPSGPLGPVSAGKMRKLGGTGVFYAGKPPTTQELLKHLLDEPILLVILENVPAGSQTQDQHLAAVQAAKGKRIKWTDERVLRAVQAAGLHAVLKREIADFMQSSVPPIGKDSNIARGVRAFRRTDKSDRWPRLLIAEVAGIQPQSSRHAQVTLHAPDSEATARLRLIVDTLIEEDVTSIDRFRRALKWNDQLPIESEWHSVADIGKVSMMLPNSTNTELRVELRSPPYSDIAEWLDTNHRDAFAGERMDVAVGKIVDGTKPDWTLQQVARVVGVDLVEAKADYGSNIVAAQAARGGRAQAPSGNA